MTVFPGRCLYIAKGWCLHPTLSHLSSVTSQAAPQSYLSSHAPPDPTHVLSNKQTPRSWICPQNCSTEEASSSSHCSLEKILMKGIYKVTKNITFDCAQVPNVTVLLCRLVMFSRLWNNVSVTLLIVNLCCRRSVRQISQLKTLETTWQGILHRSACVYQCQTTEGAIVLFLTQCWADTKK